MSWASENKFLTGYIVVMVLGAGALGWQVYSASAAYDTASTNYKSKSTTFDTLRKAKLYPDAENLKKVEAQKQEAASVVRSFQADLAKQEFPLEPMSPADFQEALRKTAVAVRGKADAAGVILGKSSDVVASKQEKFYLGFQKYETAPPASAAATLLGRDLKAIDWMVQQLIAAPVIAIKDVRRPEIPEEKGTVAPAARPSGPPGRPGAPATPAVASVSSHTFEIVFSCRQFQLAKVLNVIIDPSSPQFYILRNVKVLNSQQKAPSRVDQAAAAAAAFANASATPAPATPAPVAGQPAPAPAPAAPAVPAVATSTIKYLLGEETVEATLKVEIVDFAEPAPEAAAKPAK